MRKVSPLGLNISRALVCLLVLELLLFAAGKLVTRSLPIVTPPRQIADWVVSPGEPPVSDSQRDFPNQLSVQYTRGDESPVHVDFSTVQSVNALRLPQKYMADVDGRVSPNQTAVLMHKKREAFTASVVQGINQNIVVVHWCQRPGGDPSPMATDRMADALKSIVFRRPPLYVCDAWVELHATTKGPEVRLLLQKFADSLADTIKNGG